MARHSRTLRGSIAIVAVLLVLTACIGASTATELSGDTYVATSPDGTIPVTLPLEWHDLSEDYLAETPDSVLSAYWSTGTERGLPLTPFASVSTRPSGGVTLTAEEQATSSADGWIETLGGSIVDEGGFTTTTGAAGYWVRVDGNKSGVDTTVFSVSIVGPERTSKILIETYLADETGAPYALALIEALETVENSPVTEAERGTGTISNGLLSTGRLTADVPSTWTQQLPDAALQEFATSVEALGVGFWTLDGDQFTGTVSGILTATPAAAGFEAGVEDLRSSLGPVGVATESPDGIITPRSYDEVTLANGVVAGRACIEIEREDLGTTFEQCLYSFAQDGASVTGIVQAVALPDWAVPEFEAFLGTLTISE